MKYKDENGQWQDIILEPSGDTLPIGSIVDYDGEEVPYGYEKVEETHLIESGSNENGHYIKFSDGTLIQHTTFKVEPNNQSYDIYFPTPFIDNNYVITPMHMYEHTIGVISTFSDRRNNMIRIHNTFFNTTNKEWIYGENWAYAQTIGVIAIGKWK